MATTEEQIRAQWRADLTQIAARIDDLKARIDTESRMLYATLSAEVAMLQSELERLEVEVDAGSADVHTRQIALQIEELSAKGDAAYHLLQLGMAVQLDPTDAEIRRLEAVAATASGAAQAKIVARIDRLRSARASAQATACTDEFAGQQTGDTTR